MEKHIKNEDIYKQYNSYPLSTIIEIRKYRWLEKVSHMSENRALIQLMGACFSIPRNLGRPQQTINHSYHHAICKRLYFSSSLFSEWIHIAINHELWKEKVEMALYLKPGTY